MKQKYVMPTMELVNAKILCSILAGSGGSGEQDIGNNTGNTGGSGGSGGGISGGIGTGTGGALAKDHNFNAWESWDEY